MTTEATPQPNPLHMTVSPDRGDGARMSYLRFEDQADGVHVFFVDVTDPGASTAPTPSIRRISPPSVGRTLI